MNTMSKWLADDKQTNLKGKTTKLVKLFTKYIAKNALRFEISANANARIT